MANRNIPENLDTMPDSAKLSVREVAGWKGVSINTVWRWVRAGVIPAPKKIGPNCTRWTLGDLRAADKKAA